MIVWRGHGNLLEQDDWTQLCPVNAVGAMGKGLALAMRKAHPGLWDAYDRVYSPWHGATSSLHERARQLTHVCLPTGKVLLFCSKYHWRDPSPMELVRANLMTLAGEWQSLGIERLAMPVPGSGLGGLALNAVVAEIELAVGEAHPLPVRLYLGT